MSSPWISIAIVPKRIPNADLSTTYPVVVLIFRDSYFHRIDFMYIEKVQPPPWIHIVLRCATRSMVYIGVRVSINGFVRAEIPILTGLSGCSFYVLTISISMSAGGGKKVCQRLHKSFLQRQAPSFFAISSHHFSGIMGFIYFLQLYF